MASFLEQFATGMALGQQRTANIERRDRENREAEERAKRWQWESEDRALKREDYGLAKKRLDWEEKLAARDRATKEAQSRQAMAALADQITADDAKADKLLRDDDPVTPGIQQNGVTIQPREASPTSVTIPKLSNLETGETLGEYNIPLLYRQQVEERAARQAAMARALKAEDVMSETTARGEANAPFVDVAAARVEARADKRAREADERAATREMATDKKREQRDTEKLRTDFNRDMTKPQGRVRALERGLSMGSPKVPTMISDYALVYAFAKAADPDSAVREGEFKGIKTSTGGWGQKALQMWEDIKTGKMTSAKRADMLDTIKDGLEYEKKVVGEIQNRYGDLARTYEVNPGKLFGEKQLGEQQRSEQSQIIDLGNGVTARRKN